MFYFRPVLTVETAAFLTFEGVRFYEELELAVREQKDRPVDLRPHLRRIHLVVTALREFIQTLQTYSNFTHFSGKNWLLRESSHICSVLIGIEYQNCSLTLGLFAFLVFLLGKFNQN